VTSLPACDVILQASPACDSPSSLYSPHRRFAQQDVVQSAAERAADERGDPEHPQLPQGPAAGEDRRAGAAGPRVSREVIAETIKHGVVRYELEARLALCEIEAKTDPATARAHAKTLEEEARSKGFGLIARKALALGA